jgi:hypothetical protein
MRMDCDQFGASTDPYALVDQVVADAARSLTASFALYWPTLGDTGAHERNLSLHVGGAFLRAGFAVFGEGHADAHARSRYDLLAYSGARRVFVVAEFKQLWSRASATSMRHDADRLRHFRPVLRRFADASETRYIGLLGGFSETDSRYQQLTSPDQTRSCAATSELAAALPAGRSWRSHQLWDHGRHPDRPGPFHLVYASMPIGDQGAGAPSR